MLFILNGDMRAYCDRMSGSVDACGASAVSDDAI